KELDADARIIDDIGRLSPRSTETELRNLLGCFLFSADEVFKKIGVLSGGERNRYALLRMLLHPANFLLLDEPTNHLDLRAKDVLLEALSKYTGTVVFVSHDRYFIDRLATRVFEVGDGNIEIYPGNYEDYLWRKQGGPEQLAASQPRNGREALIEADSPAPPVASAPAPPQKRVNPIRLQQMKERCQELEEHIAQVEANIHQCETALQNFVSAEETLRLTQSLKDHRAELDTLLPEWEELAQTLQEQ
ncbi:MAG TPA: ATP-binding cassette domain-containing protein, partial [Terriglobales bacterium]|nr:ATP-binding cassette domain-containing protein [Terriglobales bacterium]